MCRAVRKTPKPPAAGAAAGAAPVLYKLSAYNSVRLHHLRYYALYLKLTGQAHDATNGTGANLDAISEYFESVNGGSDLDPDLPDYPGKFNNKNTRVMLEILTTGLKSP